MKTVPTLIAPPPWTLKGNGYIFLYHFSKEFVMKNGFLADYQKVGYNGDWVGTIMLVDYQESPVGPYQELLFVPGRCKFGGKKIFTISKIFVSSLDSVTNGIVNWGIPKELANFKVSYLSDNQTKFDVSIDGESFFSAHLKNRSFYFPISTRFFPLKLAQKLNKKLIITTSTAKGKASFAKFLSLKVDEKHFPDISKLKPIAALVVKNFKMTFPIPNVTENFFELEV